MARSRLAVLLAVAIGGLLLVASEFLVLRSVRVRGRVVPGGSETAGAHHGYALAVLGVALIVLGVAAVTRRSVPAGAGALAVALIAGWVVLAIDRPALDDAGLLQGTRALARASAGPAWGVEVAGVVLGLAGAGGALVAALGGSDAVRSRRGRARRGRAGQRAGSTRRSDPRPDRSQP